MARKMTPLQKKYRTAFRTVERRIEKLELQGYVFNKSKLPKFRKNISTSALKHLQKFTERYLKNMPSTQFRIGVNKYTTGARGAEIQASFRGKKAARTRRERESARRSARRVTQEVSESRYEKNEEYEKSEAFDEAFVKGESNEFFHVDSDGSIVDIETGEIVYEKKPSDTMVDSYTDNIYNSPYIHPDYGEALVDGLDNLISDYEQSDNRWVREKASALRDSFESADRETLADNLGYMSSDFISYVQQVLEESGGNQGDVNNNYAKIVEIQALIEGRTLEMGSLRNSFAD